MSIQTRVLKELEKAKASNTGLSAADLTKKIKTTPSKIHQAIFRLRKHDYEIVQKDNLYHLMNEPSNQNEPSSKTKTKKSNVPTDHEYDLKLLKQEISTVQPEDRVHYAEYMKKAIFYRNCALQLIKAGKLTSSLLPN